MEEFKKRLDKINEEVVKAADDLNFFLLFEKKVGYAQEIAQEISRAISGHSLGTLESTVAALLFLAQELEEVTGFNKTESNVLLSTMKEFSKVEKYTINKDMLMKNVEEIRNESK